MVISYDIRIPKLFLMKSYKKGNRIYHLGCTADLAQSKRVGCAAKLVDLYPIF